MMLRKCTCLNILLIAVIFMLGVNVQRRKLVNVYWVQRYMSYCDDDNDDDDDDDNDDDDVVVINM